MLENIATKEREVLVPAMAMPNSTSGFQANVDNTKIILAVDMKRQYRYSSFADYYVQDLRTNETDPLVEGMNRDIQYVKWSPK
jgi:dipeptidyl-peptidase-4